MFLFFFAGLNIYYIIQMIYRVEFYCIDPQEPQKAATIDCSISDDHDDHGKRAASL